MAARGCVDWRRISKVARLKQDFERWDSEALVCLQREEGRSVALLDGGVEQSESAAGAMVRTWEFILHMVRSH